MLCDGTFVLYITALKCSHMYLPIRDIRKRCFFFNMVGFRNSKDFRQLVSQGFMVLTSLVPKSILLPEALGQLQGGKMTCC